MFLAPSSSRAVDPYLQTLLLSIFLSSLGGKHRQVRQRLRVDKGTEEAPENKIGQGKESTKELLMYEVTREANK